MASAASRSAWLIACCRWPDVAEQVELWAALTRCAKPRLASFKPQAGPGAQMRIGCATLHGSLLSNDRKRPAGSIMRAGAAGPADAPAGCYRGQLVAAGLRQQGRTGAAGSVPRPAAQITHV
jgi:hypothetical protein